MIRSMSDEQPDAAQLEDWYWADGRDDVTLVSSTAHVEGLRAVFNAGRASVTPPTGEAIVEAADKAFPETEWTQPSTLLAFRQAFISGGLTVLSLFTVPPTESEGK